jgi:acyl-CoA oxidase
VETTATFDEAKDEFVFDSPTPSSAKNWISQGLYAEEAVILAELVVKGEKKGPHLFWGRIARPPARAARPAPLLGVKVESNPPKTTLRGLDNAAVTFDGFRLARSSLLSRFCSLGRHGEYSLELPGKAKRMLDILIFRLLTGRIVLSEATCSMSLARLRRNWAYAKERELWRGRKPKGKMMSDMPLVKGAFRDYGRAMHVVTKFLAHTREMVAESIRNGRVRWLFIVVVVVVVLRLFEFLRSFDVLL